MIYNLLLLYAFSGATQAISCLVMRPGYGLVSETCPSLAVGCRIKVDESHIQWYEYAKLYDRNQLVCVLPGEYQQESGCLKRSSGNIRCWCGARDDCNDPETSREQYKVFEEGGNAAVKIWQEKQKKKDMESDLEEFAGVEANDILDIVAQSPGTTPTAPNAMNMTKKHAKHHHHQKITKHITVALKTSKTTTTTERATTITEAFTKTNSIYEETQRKLEAEMKEEDDRLNMILLDEEREFMKDAEDREEERREQEQLVRSREEEKRKQSMKTKNAERYGFKRNKQHHREEEKLRVQEEERLALVERQEAEERERRAKDRELEEEMEGERKLEDYLDGMSSFGMASSQRNNSSTIHSLFAVMILLFNFLLKN